VRLDGTEVPLHVAGRDRPGGRSEWLFDILSSLHVGGGGENNTSGVRGITIVRHPPAPDGELNTLRFPGTHKVLEPGFKTEWVTVAP
jgi:hypothetical protein